MSSVCKDGRREDLHSMQRMRIKRVHLIDDAATGRDESRDATSVHDAARFLQGFPKQEQEPAHRNPQRPSWLPFIFRGIPTDTVPIFLAHLLQLRPFSVPCLLAPSSSPEISTYSAAPSILTAFLLAPSTSMPLV